MLITFYLVYIVMSSCCGNELLFNSAISEVVSNNFELIANLIQNEFSACVIIVALGLGSAALVVITLRIRGTIPITC
ncbi:unnamed protein product [Parnassius mnemosyne]|uniref:NADH dehydrogenase subunit 4L n=1 Tax=Parnassius mnemosyne TaxID=213953 RepID=A0AAV1M5J7_9NEOP